MFVCGIVFCIGIIVGNFLFWKNVGEEVVCGFEDGMWWNNVIVGL